VSSVVLAGLVSTRQRSCHRGAVLRREGQWKWWAAGESRARIQVSNAVAVGTEVIQTVNARELHGFLGSDKDFTDWIKARVTKYGFVDGVDFTTVLNSPNRGNSTGGRRRTDYHVSIDMAKELAMVERNDQGRKAVGVVRRMAGSGGRPRTTT
jgi:phage anti-repressor protein